MTLKEKIKKLLEFLRRYTSIALCGLAILILVFGVIIAFFMHASSLVFAIIYFISVTTYLLGYGLSVFLNRYKFSSYEFFIRTLVSVCVFIYVLLNLVLQAMR